MQIKILEVKDHPEGREIVAVVFQRFLPGPKYEENETDEQYAERVKPIADDMAGFGNLHPGWAELRQKPDIVNIPTVADYGT